MFASSIKEQISASVTGTSSPLIAIRKNRHEGSHLPLAAGIRLTLNLLADYSKRGLKHLLKIGTENLRFAQLSRLLGRATRTFISGANIQSVSHYGRIVLIQAVEIENEVIDLFPRLCSLRLQIVSKNPRYGLLLK